MLHRLLSVWWAFRIDTYIDLAVTVAGLRAMRTIASIENPVVIEGILAHVRKRSHNGLCRFDRYRRRPRRCGIDGGGEGVGT